MKIDVIRIIEQFSRIIDEGVLYNLKLYGFNFENYKFTTNHQFKVGHFSVHLGEKLGLSKEELEDLFILGLFHDVGFVAAEIAPENKNVNALKNYEALVGHCIIGEQLISEFPFHTNVAKVIAYHHEKYDGTGFFRISGKDIPLFSRILLVGNLIDLFYNLDNLEDKYDEICEFIKSESGLSCDPSLALPALEVLKDHRKTDFSARNEDIPIKHIEMDWNKLKTLLESLMKIIDHKSPFTYKHSTTISGLADQFSDLYNYDHIKKDKLRIAANIHDVGKLQVPLSILEKPTILTGAEMDLIMTHPTAGEEMFRQIDEFDEIAQWVGQHHEKLNGKGYPKGLAGDEILFESRVLAICDIYVALTEDRPYRPAFSKLEAIKVMKEMIQRGELDSMVFIDLLTILNQS